MSSRAGMITRAKGDKAAVFKEAAEAAGYRVTRRRDRTTGAVTLTASKNRHKVTAAWTESGAWDYPNTHDNARKGCKIRNLASALQAFKG